MSYDPPRPAGRLLLTPEDREAPERVRRLRQLGVGRHPDPALDAFADRIADMARTPYAMVNFLVENGQVFAGLHAPRTPPAGAGTTPGFARFQPRDHGFCPHVAARRRALALEDVRDYPRFAGNPVVDTYGIRSYLGAPLIDSTGTVLGAVSAADVTPRPWGRAGLETIKATAAELMRRIERSADDGLPL
ncbi:GAF domain-containing protein [Streptomyces griseoviridis]|jgi:GAF domain-containing protein|uniref:Histidine kinase n=3 Tax=Streptomyces TaxID=1883 RepID=A0A918GFG6_STRGD|nr:MULTISPECIES: GAF domain-containing protein [Streptomyces]MDP9685493.1 GAF domain-containing protein [Streptomyces griseoviridis]GGS32640.1 histidine kinase [Streptomyces niveoruber]GGS87838.1 histidine kinase [Streptomyces griseoviridis]GGU30087.1 histidine kinase [Streptomyces daghestanicus]GHI33063.1 histidine kinase [Streptomyces daghestanicus]